MNSKSPLLPEQFGTPQIARSSIVVRVAGVYPLIGGMLTFIGWAAGYYRLTDWDGSGISMKANAALAAMAAGVSLLLVPSRWGSRWVQLLGAFVGAIGALTLFEHASGLSLGIDTLLFHEPVNARATAAPGRMGPPASTCFTLIGIVLILRSRQAPHARLAIGMATTVLVIALLSLTGYLYGADAMYSVPKLSGIAMQTATILIVISVGLLASYAEHDPLRALYERTAAGVLTRRLLPFVILVPLGIGWLRLKGQDAGLYDTAFGAAMRTVIEVGLLGGMLYWCIRGIRRFEQAREAATHQLMQSERQLAHTLESITDGLVTLDAHWRFSYVNSEAERLLERPKQELLGTNVWELYPEMISTNVERDLRRVAAERITLEVEGLNSRMGRIFLNRVYPGLDGGVAVYFHDITQRRQDENALREANQRKDEFLATLAHELRNPLAPIRNAARLFQIKESSSHQLTWGAEVIDRQVKHMSRLLDDLLDVSRISRNRLELKREWVDIRGVVESAVETSKPLLDANCHELLLVLPQTPIFIDADEVRVAQVISNLLNNAAKYTPTGGHIKLQAELVDRNAVISVTDDGIGVSPEKLGKVFDIFWQDSDAKNRAQGGLGIGLSLAKGLTELHDGSIEARSAGLDKGSQFTVKLPAVFAPPKLGESTTDPPVRATPARRILVVDDLRDNADSLAIVLASLGHETHTAYDGSSALEAASRHQPDVIFLDIGMPGMGGLEVCRRLRQEAWGKTTYIAALTGWGQATDRQRSTEAGFDCHLTKPVDIDELTALLHSIPRTT
jgi:PAS domain S-box-containing protein